MPLPFYFHIGNSGGLSFVRAVGSAGIANGILVINNEDDFKRVLPRLAAQPLARLTFALGHAVYLADPWINDRHEITILRWPQAVFCANSTFFHEQPEYSSLAEVFTIADPHDRLRAYLDHLEQGGSPDLRMTLAHWMNDRHKFDCETFPKRAERQALLDTCDNLLRDYYHLVGITELMDETLFLFQADFPDRKVTPWVRTRANKQRIDPFSLPADIVSRFEHEYEADIALYNRARQRLLARFVEFWRTRPDMRDHYLVYKTAMILTDPLLMARFAEGDPLYFPTELPLEDLRACVVSQLDRAHEIRTNIMRAYG